MPVKRFLGNRAQTLSFPTAVLHADSFDPTSAIHLNAFPKALFFSIPSIESPIGFPNSTNLDKVFLLRVSCKQIRRFSSLLIKERWRARFALHGSRTYRGHRRRAASMRSR